MRLNDLRYVASVVPLSLALLLAGCAGDVDDDPVDSAGSAASEVAAYEKVIRNGTSVESKTTPTAAESASTKLTGWIPNVAPEKVLTRLLTVGSWKDITDAEGERPFTQSSLVRQSGTGNVRTVDAKLSLSAGVDIDAKATAKEDGTNLSVKIVNTSEYRHWFVGTVLKKEKLVIDLELVPYKSGTIVKASMKLKLESVEDRAPGVTKTLVPMFDWLKRTSR
ncbi:MAG: hypothetical protein JST00_23870 [Deltaproteobacteria bacterium]|nr:hypothetical protein [Deltaproteobacteria bacterium]